jgi:hypothetical protein
MRLAANATKDYPSHHDLTNMVTMHGNLEALVLLLALPSCGLDRVNEAPLEKYSEKLVRRSGASLKVDGCKMFERTRKGRCLLTGSAAEQTKFVRGLKLNPDAGKAVFGKLTCLALPDFGTQDDTARVKKPGVARFVKGAPLPTNKNNVRFVAVYTGPGSVCVELEYPYG